LSKESATFKNVRPTTLREDYIMPEGVGYSPYLLVASRHARDFYAARGSSS
jgi:hypothetical protein